jgi:hypothetical protein
MDKSDWDLIYDYNKNTKQRELIYPLSGWKIYICGESEEDSKFIYSILEDVIVSYNLGWKNSKQKFFEDSKGTSKEKVAFFIYLPVKIVNDNLQNKLVKEISDILIKNNYRKDFDIPKRKKLANSIYCRYEMNTPFRVEGFLKEDYKKFYQRSKESFNLENNFDIFE